MLSRKSVYCTETEMHLWDEAGNHLHSYIIEDDTEMCAFLVRMMQLGVYERRADPGLSGQRIAA